MARHLSKRKKPSREDFVLKEVKKIESEVFDKETLLSLAKIIKKGIIATVDYPISTGKEANVFRATTSNGEFLAIKIYKVETAPFSRKKEYIEGDPRFEKIKHSERELVRFFARKEFKNLEICSNAGVHAPKPIFLEKNIVVMGFLGENGLPYPTMNMAGGPRSEADLESILDDIKKMYKAGLVHADISEYNILLGPRPYLIDFGQGVVLSHPRSQEFLERDVRNILNYFSKYGIKRDFEKTIEWIKN